MGCPVAATNQIPIEGWEKRRRWREEVGSPVTCHYRFIGEAQLKSGCELLL